MSRSNLGKNPFISGLVIFVFFAVGSWILQQICYFLLNFVISNDDRLQSFKPLVDFLPFLGFIVGITLFLINLGFDIDVPWNRNMR